MNQRSQVLLVAPCFLLLLFVSCTFSVNYREGRFACSSATDCPLGYTCGGDKLCQRTGSGCDGGNCTEGGTPEPGKSCQKHDDCELTQTCRPDLEGQGRFCVLRCNVVTQEGCNSSQVCVLSEGRGYCRTKRGAKGAGLLCNQDLDCELHLYCRSVKGFPFIKRCAQTCDERKGCSQADQRCLTLRPEDSPIGYCEPMPRVVKQGEVCSGDLICESGFECKASSPGGTPTCR